MKLEMNRRKALGLSAATAVASGLILSKRWSRSEGLPPSHPDLHGASDHPQWHLKDLLHAASGTSEDVKRSLALVSRSAREAWERRQVARAAAAAAAAAARSYDGAAAAAPPRPTPATLLADFLAALNEGGAAAERPGRGTQLLNSRLGERLLERAAAGEAEPGEQEATVRYIAAVLRSEEAAEALLQRPGAAPMLLALARRAPPLRPLLAEAAARGEAARLVPHADAAAVVALVTEELRGLRGGSAPPTAAPRHELLLAGLQLLLGWARASPGNASRLAEAGAGPLLAELAAGVATGSGAEALQGAAAALMGVLARQAGGTEALRMQGWLYPLLCLAADAAAGGHWQLAHAALDAFAACLLRGCELPAQLMQRSALPLLHRLAAAPACPVRPAIALAVRALAEGPGVQLPLEERERWVETLLQWLVEQPGSQGGDGGNADGSAQERSGDGDGAAAGRDTAPLLQARLAAALGALSAPPGSQGLHVAHAWLAELIVHLSHAVGAPPAQLEARKSVPEEAGGGGDGRWWWARWWYGSGTAPSPASQGPSGGVGSSSGPATGAQEEQAAAAAAAQAAVASGGAEAVAGLPAAEQATAAAAAAAAGTATDGPLYPLEAPASVDDEAAAGGSWWRMPAWLGRGGGGAAAEQPAAQPRAAAKPSDSELALYINAAPVGPVYARSVAAALLEASGRVGSFQEPPANAEELLGPEVVAVYPQVAAAIDWDLADAAVCQALKVLCALASGASARRAWLLDSGVLPLLRRLTLERQRDVEELPPGAGGHLEAGLPLCIQRQAVRLLAMLAGDVAGAARVQREGWVPWLQRLAVSTDLKLSSCASRTLLHIESAAATQRPGLASLAAAAAAGRGSGAPLLLPPPVGDAGGAAAAGDASGEAGQRTVSVEAAEAAAQMLGEARLALAQARRSLDRRLDAVRAAVPPQERLVLQDGVHLFDPLARHHEVLAREGVAADTSDAPLLDIVFVHGIRGGAFATWRREGVLERGQARESLDRSVCWPSSWVAAELPEARLISIEYAAPATGWEGESLPFQLIVAQLADKLAAAGVGRRPVVFVAHSMGGLIVKDLLVSAASADDERLRRLHSAAAGAVFYSVPHAGSRLADWGWYLRYVGGAPARHVQRLKTGHHQEELNAAVRAMCKSGRLPVLSFSEGLPTRLGYIPTHVVPHESAFPGYGEFVVLQQHDHISVCKPTDRADPAYARLMAFLHARAREVRLARAAAAAARVDHMEGSVL